MTYREFCNMIAPSVLELQNLCKRMTEKEFTAYRKTIMQEIHSNKPDINEQFINAVFDIIYENVFQTA